jgi:hypothetical protein
MIDEMITVGDEFPDGLVLDYWTSNPEQLIIKVQGTLNNNVVNLKGLVNVGHTNEIHFEDSVEVEDYDSIWCEPDGLVVLRSGATDEQIEPINNMKVQIGTYFDGTFIANPTVQP